MDKNKKQKELVGRRIILTNIETSPNGTIYGLSIEAVILSYNEKRFNIRFIEPVEINQQIEESAWISPRYVGQLISLDSRDLVVNGEFGSSQSFLAFINLIK